LAGHVGRSRYADRLRPDFFVRARTPTVMPGHSRSKNGVASLAYVPGIHVLF
jgi:hypothetical protein